MVCLLPLAHLASVRGTATVEAAAVFRKHRLPSSSLRSQRLSWFGGTFLAVRPLLPQGVTRGQDGDRAPAVMASFVRELIPILSTHLRRYMLASILEAALTRCSVTNSMRCNQRRFDVGSSPDVGIAEPSARRSRGLRRALRQPMRESFRTPGKFTEHAPVFGLQWARAVPSMVANRGLAGVPQMGWLLMRD